MRKENKSNNDKQCMKEKETKIRENTKVAMQVNKVMSRLYPSTSQPCKRVGPMADKVQTVWFGRKGGRGKTYNCYPAENTFGNLPC